MRTYLIADKYGFITTLNDEAIGLAITAFLQNTKVMAIVEYNFKKQSIESPKGMLEKSLSPQMVT
jgi:hypothetical protein